MSWKNFGGVQQIKRANLYSSTITTDNIVLRKSYSGDFNIAGSINISLNATIGQNLLVSGSATLNDVCMNTLTVNGNTFLNGDTSIPTTLNANNIIVNNLYAVENTQIDSQLFMNEYHYLYGTSTGIGVDRLDPVATFDIYSDQLQALNVGTSSVLNRNILARNSFNRGIVLGTSTFGNFDIKLTGIDFFTNTQIDISNIQYDGDAYGDAYIHCSSLGIMSIKTPTDIQILSNMVISGSQDTLDIMHLSTETLALYDTITPNQYYFSDVYNTNTSLGKSAAFISSDSNNTSITTISLTDTLGCGAKFYGGHYPLTKRPMLSYGVTDNCGNYMPTETIVAGTATNTKYLVTTGINKYKPITDNYVLDINGPVHIDNGDIVNVKNTNFEILYVKNAIHPSYKNYVMAIGASTDISGTFIDQNGDVRYRYSVLYSADGGATWKSSVLNPSTLINLSNAVLQDNLINQIDVYDCSYAFITGHYNTMIYTFNGGITWQNISIFGAGIPTMNPVNFNALKIKPITNGLSVYFSIDANLNSNTPSFFTNFDVTFSEITGIRPGGQTLTRTVTLRTPTTPIHINSIGLGNSTLYLAGDKIFIYNLSNLTVIDTSFNGILSQKKGGNGQIDPSACYIWSNIEVYSDTYAVAIATGLTTGNDGINADLDISTSIISVISNKIMVTWNSYTSQSFFNTIDYGDDPQGPQQYKYPMECIINDIFIYDTSKCIIVGNARTVNIQGVNIVSEHGDGSFILVSYDSGITWNDISTHYLNASGKENLLIGSKNIANNGSYNTAKNIIIPNINTLLISYSTIPSVFDPIQENCVASGSSTIYSCFTPNFLNAQNNKVMDICGNVNIDGSLFAKTITCNSFQNLSDYRIKTDICPLNEQHVSIDRLNPVQYTNKLSGKCEWGFIAHELQEELPLLVEGVKDGEGYQYVNYSGIIALLVKEIQVLKKEVEDLRR